MRNKKVRIMAAALMVFALVCGAFSYFTDYASKDLSATAGTLTIDMTNATADLTNGLTIMNPGDSNPLSFTVNNTGSKSADVKAVITVKADQAMTEADHEFKVTDVNGTELQGTLSADKTTMVYTIDDKIINGSVETDVVTRGLSDDTKSYTYNYQFAMDADAKNIWQDKGASVKIEAFAKQHRNTTSLDAADWTQIVEK